MSAGQRQAVIFLNGDRTDLSGVRPYIDGRTLLIGCDGGTRHILALGYKPAVVIGDFDSYEQPAETDGIVYVRHPADKDYTDAELAVGYAAEHGCRRIILAGALGTRLDHLLGNILMLGKEEFAPLDIKIIEGRQEIYLIRGQARINGAAGDIISFIPVNGPAEVSRSSGLKYDLSRYNLSPQTNLGISNVMTGPVAEVRLKTNVLLVVHQRQAQA